jgi:type VI protein secretion system component Hcp
MADQSKTDLFMKFRLQNGKHVPAECALDKSKDDPFMADFEPAPYQDYSNFFEVFDFDFSLKLTDHDQDTGALGKQRGNGANGRSTSRVAGQYARWRSLTDDQVRAKLSYPVEFNQFQFKRLIDSASPIFFQYCLNSISFQDAALVKRVSQGDGSSIGYLRLDFTDVLITNVDWDDGDVVTESCTFICKKLVVKYRSQAASGTLQKESEPATWDQNRNSESA